MVTTPSLVAARGPAWPADRLVVVDGARVAFDPIDALPRWLRAGDLLLVNDAATLPAALCGDGFELRLAARLGPTTWRAAVLGAGSWRDPTERRGEPPALPPIVRLGAWEARVVHQEGRWAVIDLGPEWLAMVYQAGEPIRYSYLDEEAPLAAFQTAFAARPWASESPSAALPLRWSLLLALRRAGVHVAALTHAAGLSSVDGATEDAALPLRERSDLPAATLGAIEAARARGGRVIAAGTTVVRAIEGRVLEHGRLVPGEAQVSTVFAGTETPRVLDGLLTKLHGPEESHFRVLSLFGEPARLTAAFAEAARRGLRNHEFGDSALLLR